MTTAAVSLHDVRKVYDVGTHHVAALDGVTTDIARGAFTAVMGPSGSGKSTLLQCAAGLDQPSSGTVTLDGVDIGALGETARTVLRRDRVGFVFQEFNLVSSLTAAQNVTLTARLAGRRPTLADATAALAEVGLADFARHRPTELSGGQQQRVAIARALFSRPAVLFADEPTGALDSRTSRQVLDLLRALVDEHGQTIVMVTHDPVAAAGTDEIVMLADGRVVDRFAAGTAASIGARMAACESSC